MLNQPTHNLEPSACANASDVVAVIPARMASTRLPGKPLLAETGRPMIAHVLAQAQACPAIDRVIVATDENQIVDAVHAAGGEARMTRADHPNGTARIAEVVTHLDGLSDSAIVVNVQGDEPEVDPKHLTRLVQTLRAADPAVPMATLAVPISAEDATNPNLVKVVCSEDQLALYFSRSPVPYHREPSPSTPATMLRHLGVYAYRAGFLPVYAALPPTPLEQAERLEQLRALEHGHRIAVAVLPEGESVRPGIDTPEQYAAFVRRWQENPR